jgi:hypothetical protein
VSRVHITLNTGQLLDAGGVLIWCLRQFFVSRCHSVSHWARQPLSWRATLLLYVFTSTPVVTKLIQLINQLIIRIRCARLVLE